jgi:two-component system sensor histidine kinase ChvG
MTIEISRLWEAASARRPGRAIRLRLLRTGKLFFYYRFNSITRRIIVINVIGVAVLVIGIFYLNQNRWKLMATRVENLTAQAQIIATAIAQTSKTGADAAGETGQAPGDENKIVIQSGLSNQELSFRINPEVVSPILHDLAGKHAPRSLIQTAR